jgi:hypothetical protein
MQQTTRARPLYRKDLVGLMTATSDETVATGVLNKARRSA